MMIIIIIIIIIIICIQSYANINCNLLQSGNFADYRRYLPLTHCTDAYSDHQQSMINS